MEVGQAVKDIKAGKIEFRVDKSGLIHAGLGKVSFDKEKIVENVKTFIHTVAKLRPSSSKGQYIEKIVISSTMGPALKLDHQAILQDM